MPEHADETENHKQDLALLDPLGDGSDVDQTEDEDEVGDPVKLAAREKHIMRMLYSWAEDESDSEMSELPEDDKDDLDDMVETNHQMAAACANQCSVKDELTINKLADKVQDKRESQEFVASNSTLSDPEQQQEALLQEILSRSSSSIFDGCENQETDHVMEAVDSKPTAQAQVTDQMMNRFAQRVEPTMEEAFMDRWRSALLETIDALVYRHQRKDVPLGNGGNELSLVFKIQTANESASASVVLVQWSSTNLRNGRSVHLEEQNRIVCPINFIQKARNFKNSGVHMILPAVGETVRRVKKAERPPLPNNALLLMNMYKTAIACQGKDAEASMCFEDDINLPAAGTCAICHSDNGILSSCALCALTAHRECAMVLRSKVDGQVDGGFTNVGHDNANVGTHIIPNILLGPEPGPESSTSSQWHALLVL